MNIIAMNLRNTKIYAFTAEGEFIEFDVNIEKHTVSQGTLQHIDQFKQDL